MIFKLLDKVGLLKQQGEVRYLNPGEISRVEPGRRGQYGLLDAYTSDIVSACIFWAMRNVPRDKPKMRRNLADGTIEEVENHPLLNLLNSPNEDDTFKTLMQAVIPDYMIDGNAYLVRDNNGGMLVPVSVLHITPHVPYSRSRKVEYYEYNNGAETIRLEPEQVIQFKFGSNPEHPYRGISVLKSMQADLYSADKADDMVADLLKNFATPGMIFMPNDPGIVMTKEQVDESMKNYKAAFGNGNTGNSMFTQAKMDVQQKVPVTPKDLKLEEMYRQIESRVAACFGIPAMVVGLKVGLDRSTFSNYAEATEAAYRDFVSPMQMQFTDTLNRVFLTSSDLELYWESSGVLEPYETLAERTARVISLRVSNIITTETAAEMLDVEPAPEEQGQEQFDNDDED